jgi:hypothetical protein
LKNNMICNIPKTIITIDTNIEIGNIKKIYVVCFLHYACGRIFVAADRQFTVLFFGLYISHYL